MGLLGQRTSVCQSFGHPGTFQDIPGYSWDYLNLGCQGLGHPRISISQDVLGYFWDYLGLGHPGISREVPGYSWDYLDLGQVVARAWDIPGYPSCPRVSLGLLGPGTEGLPEPGMSPGILGTTWTWDKWLPGLETSQHVPGYSWDYLDLGQRGCQSLGHPRISRDVPGYSWDYLDLGQVVARAWDIPGYPSMSQGILGTTWTWDRGVARAWDIPRYPGMSPGILGTTWDKWLPGLRTSQDVLGTA